MCGHTYEGGITMEEEVLFNLEKNFIAFEVFENGSRKVIGFFKKYAEAKELLKFKENKIEIVQGSLINRNYLYEKKYGFKKSQHDHRSKRLF